MGDGGEEELEAGGCGLDTLVQQRDLKRVEPSHVYVVRCLNLGLGSLLGSISILNIKQAV